MCTKEQSLMICGNPYHELGLSPFTYKIEKKQDINTNDHRQGLESPQIKGQKQKKEKEWNHTPHASASSDIMDNP